MESRLYCIIETAHLIEIGPGDCTQVRIHTVRNVALLKPEIVKLVVFLTLSVLFDSWALFRRF